MLHDDIARTYGLIRASDVVTQAAPWSEAGRIFSVAVDGELFYPGFQFDAAGVPVPQMAAVLSVLGAHLRGWELAAWCQQPLDELDGLAPIAAWVDRPKDVLEAARYTASTLI